MLVGDVIALAGLAALASLILASIAAPIAAAVDSLA